MDHNKININGKEYDLRDLSDNAKQLVNVLNIADRELAVENAKLYTMKKGREAVVAELIEVVEKETTTNE